MSVQGVPEQDKPENQDPSVAYSIDGMTGEKKAYDGYELPKETGEEKPERRSKTPSDRPEQSEGEKKEAEEKADQKNKSVKAASTATAGGTGAHAGKP